MIDPYGRNIEYMRISVTERCNYRCVYCMGPEGVSGRKHAEELSFAQIAEIAAAAARCGMTKLRLTGGEPLMRQGIAALCGMLRAIPGIRELTMTTNGSLLRELAQPLKEAGLDRLNVSLDSLDPGRFREITRCGRLEEVLEGLEAASRAGFTGTKLDTVLLGGVNTDEIAALAELTRAQPISVRFIELMPMGVCAGFPGERFVPADLVLEALPELEPLGREGVAECFRLPGARGTVGLIRALSHSFCESCNRIRLTADGMLKPCLHAAAEIPVRDLHGEALLQAVARAVAAKPPCHGLTERGVSETPRNMNEIGG